LTADRQRQLGTMKKNHKNLGESPRLCFFSRNVFIVFALLVLGTASGSSQGIEETFFLQPGDQIEISFPGAPDLDRSLRIRRDGIAAFPLIGEVKVDGLTTGKLEEELEARYEGQLVTNEVMVGVLNSSFTYYVEGAVNSPGKINSFRQLTALEAVLEAGGHSEIAKIDAVKIIRRKQGKYESYKVNLRKILDGNSDETFLLEPFDIVSVPQKFW